MRKLIVATLVTLLAANVALAQAPAANDCEAKAVGKNGKPLAGAAKTAFMKKCQGEQGVGADACAAQAAEKKLAGAAKNSFLKKCHADAKAAK